MSSGETFTNFYGEMLIQPIPLELSLNYCSHGCPYCFANLNSQVRKRQKGSPLRFANEKAIYNLIRDRHKRKSLEAYWLREGYPVLISNRVDPFANSNYKLAVPIMRKLTEEGIPIAIQTRGGKGIDEVLDFLPRSCWYISIDHSDDATRQHYAPANPSIESRYELIAKLRERGHLVYVGMNPLSVEWMPQPERILERCKDLGVSGVWIEVMHLNREQAKVARDIGQMPATMIDRYRKQKWDDEVVNHWLGARRLAREMGLATAAIGQSTDSNYWDGYKAVYPKLLPTMQDFVNHCHEQGWGSNRLISFEEFAAFFEPHLPTGTFRLGHYIAAVAHQIPRETEGWSNWMTFRDLLRWIWCDSRIRWCPVRYPAFAYVGGESEGEALRDTKDLPYIAFWREFTEFTMEEI
jgi:DNA repair photolyase